MFEICGIKVLASQYLPEHLMLIEIGSDKKVFNMNTGELIDLPQININFQKILASQPDKG